MEMIIEDRCFELVKATNDPSDGKPWWVQRRIGYYNCREVTDYCETAGEALEQMYQYIKEVKSGMYYDLF